MRSLSVQQSKI